MSLAGTHRCRDFVWYFFYFYFFLRLQTELESWLVEFLFKLKSWPFFHVKRSFCFGKAFFSSRSLQYPSENNQSISILEFVPGIDDDGKYLTCRAENPLIPNSALEDKWYLDVHYEPIVRLQMGSTLNPDDIKEGDDVYFECDVDANPKAYKLAWFKDVSCIFFYTLSTLLFEPKQ